MAQATDVIINSAGYMIEPGSYKRLQDGFPEGSTERIQFTDFFGGQHRAIQLERDTFADSLAIGPALGGQGVQPWGNIYEPFTLTAMVGTTPNCEATIPHVIVRDRLYVAIGKTLYKGTITTPTTGGDWILAKTFANTIVDMCIYSSYGILLTFGDAADIVFYNTLTGTDAVLFAGERGTSITAYAGHAARSDARTSSRPTIIRMVTGSQIDWRPIDYDPIAMTVVGAEMLVVTKNALYTYTGRVKDYMYNNPAYTVGGTQPAQLPGREWSGEFKPFFQQGVYTERDDFRFVVGYGGRVVAWIAGGVHELVPSGDRAGWRSTGLTGRRCFGGTVAAGYVIIAIESESNQNEIWAYDGNGWWRLASKPMPASGYTGVWCNPIAIGKGIVHRNVMVFQHGGKDSTLFRLEEDTTPAGSYLPNQPASAEFVTSMIDAHERDKPKAWRKLGAVFAAPKTLGLQSSTDGVTIYLDYSIDAGVTWVQVATQSPAGNTIANMNVDLSAALSGIVSTFLILRVRWASVKEWAPVLVGVWAEYEVLHNPARRRKWEFKVHARDQEVDRNGSAITRTGRQLIAELWSAWENDATLTFRDIDYTAAPTQRTVRIVGISEAVAQPSE